MKMRPAISFVWVLLLFCLGCANITMPTGGKKDTTPPRMVSIEPKDSLRNIRISRIEMHFDEYVTVNDVAKEVQISPILSIAPTVTARNKTVVVKITDSLLEENTTYRISFGSSIRDLHEGNPFPKYTYSFSTGSYFDSLQLTGNVLNAATGLPDSGTVKVELYYASDNDSAVVRNKPRYVTTASSSGDFIFKGLPHRNFRIFALKDANNNLVYDGPSAGELIGFSDTIVTPGDTSVAPVQLRIFAERLDTLSQHIADSITRAKTTVAKPKSKDPLSYSVRLDTFNRDKRSFDITGPITITFNHMPVLNLDKVTLTYDTSTGTISPPLVTKIDSAKRTLTIRTDWLENTVYKLRLVKGFAKDSANEAVPSRYYFRTKEDDDYGKITLYLPSRYRGPEYLLQVRANGDSIYQKPITDTVISLTKLRPARYTFKIIVDKNRNGAWDAGDLFGKLQPEMVIPHDGSADLRPGYEFNIDFQPPQPKNTRDKPASK